MTEARVPNRAVNTANTAVQTAKKANFSSFIKAPNVYKSIEGTLGSSVKAKTFVSSVISAVNTNAELAKCEPTSIISAALLGESLNLSPSPQLAQYYMVPFNDKTRGKVATFILGWKGYYQLAMRSGAYKKLHAIEIKEGELVKCDPINEEYEFSVIEDPAERASKKTIGYYAFFETVNGFRKSMYWTREQMEAHAMEYSAGYKKKTGYTDWEKNFDGMGIKTMFRQIISKYGIMSIELRTAFENDESFSDKLPEDGNFTEQVHFDAVNTFDAETGEVIDN